MTQSTVTGPCGLAATEIIKVTGGYCRIAAHMKLTSTFQLMAACRHVINTLTEEARQGLSVGEVPFSEDDLQREVHAAVAALRDERLSAHYIAISGPEGPEMSTQHVEFFSECLLKAVRRLQPTWDATISDLIRFVIWVLVALLVRAVYQTSPGPMPRKKRAQMRWRP